MVGGCALCDVVGALCVSLIGIKFAYPTGSPQWQKSVESAGNMSLTDCPGRELKSLRRLSPWNSDNRLPTADCRLPNSKLCLSAAQLGQILAYFHKLGDSCHCAAVLGLCRRTSGGHGDRDV